VLSKASQGEKVPDKLAALAHQDNVAVQAVHAVQAHGSAVAFLTAAFMAGFAVLVAAVVINVKKTDVPADPMEAAVAAV